MGALTALIADGDAWGICVRLMGVMDQLRCRAACRDARSATDRGVLQVSATVPPVLHIYRSERRELALKGAMVEHLLTRTRVALASRAAMCEVLALQGPAVCYVATRVLGRVLSAIEAPAHVEGSGAPGAHAAALLAGPWPILSSAPIQQGGGGAASSWAFAAASSWAFAAAAAAHGPHGPLGEADDDADVP